MSQRLRDIESQVLTESERASLEARIAELEKQVSDLTDEADNKLKEFIGFIGNVDADVIRVRVSAKGVNYVPYDAPMMLRYAGAIVTVAFMTALIWLYTHSLGYALIFQESLQR